MEPVAIPASGASFASVFAPEEGAYAVKLPAFEGPLDLLLALIRLNEVDVTDISIALIAEQYLEYLELMRELDLDVAGEYLLMAATLALIKSRTLLPSDAAEGEDGEGEDPRAELVARLLEYQRFKEAAGDLGRRALLGRDVFRARSPSVERTPEGDREIEVGFLELCQAVRQALVEAPGRGGVHEVAVETITVRERMIAVMEILERTETVEFHDLLVRADGRLPTRALIVATFLATLELTRLAALRLYQGVGPAGSPTGPLRLRRAEGDGSSWNENIPEVM